MSQFPQTAQAGLDAAGLERIEQWMESYIDSGKSAGMLTLLSRNGEVAQLSCRGYADIASKRPITSDTIFRLYSMTKPITSVALMTLLEQGRCELGDTAKRWIPALAGMEVYQQGKIESDITIHQLLTHTAGFSYGFEPDKYPLDKLYVEVWRQRPQDQTLQQLMQTLLELPLLAQPGSRWHYSVATDICGYLIEILADMPLADYLQQTIFDPLGMVDSAFEVAADKIDRFATLYGYSEQDPLAQLERNETSPFISSISGIPVRLHSGGGGLTSTALDYLRFAQMMLNRGQLDGRRILKPETVALMTRNHLPLHMLPLSFNGVARGAYSGYGFGLGYCINIDPDDTAAAGSAGDFSWGGMADTYCWVDPQQQLIGILMQQYLPSLHHAGRKEFRDCVYQALA
ncbi:MAG: beta-lactamase family protein [Gammaproteobacteria bacterium]|jgi:CubicO group peptidase (beta-lactamase class C family)|nr:beta-lactamase family protein [Gammaproteobacteria bacterium]